MNNKYLIFAHYHPNGMIRNDILEFLKKSQKIFKEIIFISTKIKKNQIKKIPKQIKIIKRRNIGYDYYSHKKGWEYLNKKFDRNLYNKNLFFTHSGILFVKPDKLLNLISKKSIGNKEFWGVTRSLELTDHIQTYFFFFSGNLFENKNIFNWWKNIKTWNNRNKVEKFELGLSNLMIQNDIKIISCYKKNIKLKTKNVFKKFNQRIREIFLKEPKYYKKDPLKYFWRDLYNKYGFIKTKYIEYIKENNPKHSIKDLYPLLKQKDF